MSIKLEQHQPTGKKICPNYIISYNTSISRPSCLRSGNFNIFLLNNNEIYDEISNKKYRLTTEKYIIDKISWITKFSLHHQSQKFIAHLKSSSTNSCVIPDIGAYFSLTVLLAHSLNLFPVHWKFLVLVFGFS